jgi:hypothetical protein
MTHALTADGHCYCGAFRFTVAIPAGERPIFAAYCHCDSCRRAHAAPLYHVVCVEDSHFQVTKGHEFINEFKKAGGSIVRAFVTCCGTRVLNRFPSWRPGGRTPLVFFPNLLTDGGQNPLPELLRPTKHNRGQECVLDREFLAAFLEQG